MLDYKKDTFFKKMLDIQFDFDVRTTVDNPKYSTLKHVMALINEVAEVSELAYSPTEKEEIKGELIDCYAFWLGLFIKYGKGKEFPTTIHDNKTFIPILKGVTTLNVLANKMVWSLGGEFKYWSVKEPNMKMFANKLMEFYEVLITMAGYYFKNEEEVYQYYVKKMGINNDRQDSGKY